MDSVKRGGRGIRNQERRKGGGTTHCGVLKREGEQLGVHRLRGDLKMCVRPYHMIGGLRVEVIRRSEINKIGGGGREK